MTTAAPTLVYEEARSLIQNGDLISFIPKSGNFLHYLTQKVTKSDYYHSAIAVWMQSQGGVERLFVCEAHRGGRRLVPLSMYSNNTLDVTECPVNFSRFERSMFENVGQVPYGFADFVTVGVRNVFGVTFKDADGEICSEMVQKLYKSAGMSMPDYVFSPGELYGYLKACKIQDRVRIVPQ